MLIRRSVCVLIRRGEGADQKVELRHDPRRQRQASGKPRPLTSGQSHDESVEENLPDWCWSRLGSEKGRDGRGRGVREVFACRSPGGVEPAV